MCVNFNLSSLLEMHFLYLFQTLNEHLGCHDLNIHPGPRSDCWQTIFLCLCNLCNKWEFTEIYT